MWLWSFQNYSKIVFSSRIHVSYCYLCTTNVERNKLVWKKRINLGSYQGQCCSLVTCLLSINEDSMSYLYRQACVYLFIYFLKNGSITKNHAFGKESQFIVEPAFLLHQGHLPQNHALVWKLLRTDVTFSLANPC